MALTDNYNARYNYPTLIKRTIAQVAKSAQDILVENPDTTNHSNRFVWAQDALNNPNFAADKMMWYIASDSSALSYPTPDDVTDPLIKDIVDSNIDNITQG